MGAPLDLSAEKRVKEVSLILIGLGIAVCAFVALIQQALRAAPPLLGVPRWIAVGVSAGGLGALHVVLGVALLVKRSGGVALAGALANTVLALWYFGFMIAAGALSVTLLSIGMAAMPIAVWSRTLALLKSPPPPPPGRDPWENAVG